MLPTKSSRQQAVFWGSVAILLLLGGVLHLAHSGILVSHPEFFLTPIIQQATMYSFLLASVLTAIALLVWLIKHGIHKGTRHAFLHARILSGVRRALLEARYYIEEGNGSCKLARLPRLKLTLENDCINGVLRIENHVRFEKRYETIPLSSCLGHFIVDQHYLTDSQNEVIFEISDSREQRQIIFDNADVFQYFSMETCGSYELFLDGISNVPLGHSLIVGQTGSGKTYALYSLILQMLGKSTPYNLYFADPKASSLAILGDKVSMENTAETVDDIISLLRRFHSAMEYRKPEVKAGLSAKLDDTYADLGLSPHVLIVDEFSSFQACVATMDRKVRDEVASLLKGIVMQGRQLGFFLWIVMQKSDAASITTDIRDNLVTKIVLGQSERTTYETAFGVSAVANIPNRRYLPGQGVFTCPGVTLQGHPKLCYFPTLRFDILDAIQGLYKDASS